MFSRRQWLKAAGVTGAGLCSNLVIHTRQALAADYKALVCVALHGGNDGLNTVVPLDLPAYAQYSAVRKALSIPKSSLVPIGNSNYGLHPAMGALRSAAAEGALVPVLNVGPLAAPLTKAQYVAAAAGSSQIPSSLFSHPHQQSLWESCDLTLPARTGWGGRAVDLGGLNPVVALGGSSRFGAGSRQGALVLPSAGKRFGLQGLDAQAMAQMPNAARSQALHALYGREQDLVLRNAFASQQRNAFAVAQTLAPIINSLPNDGQSPSAVNVAFAPLIRDGLLTTSLAAQLYQIAKLIAARSSLPGTRQIFCVQLGGFDTHAGQLAAGDPLQGKHALLLKEVGDAMAAFHSAMKNLGMQNAVTSFTQSEFGRTFTPNSSGGTDHGWGNHQIVLGGAVKGHTAYGTLPELIVGGKDDVGVKEWELQGRWIPTISVDQYAATLLAWFGADSGLLDAILPNLAKFGTRRNLGFLSA